MSESKMHVTALAQWAGAKRMLAPTIVEAIGPHNAYWEPFCGGLPVLLAKPKSRLEIVNDLHFDVTNLARVVADTKLGCLLYRRLRRVLFCQQLHLEAQGRLAEETDPLERAYLYFIVSWMAWGGMAGTKRGGRKMSVRYTNNGGQQSTRFHRAVSSIPAWRRRLRGVSVLSTDAFDLIETIEDAKGTAVYVDPPYIGNKVEYEHAFPEPDEERKTGRPGHLKLAEILRRFKKTRVVLSYYDHPLLDELYPGWSKRIIEVNKLITQIGKRGPHRQKAWEVLLVNEPDAHHPLFAATKETRG